MRAKQINYSEDSNIKFINIYYNRFKDKFKSDGFIFDDKETADKYLLNSESPIGYKYLRTTTIEL